MKIYNEDQLIAYSEGNQIILVEGTPEDLVPIGIFGLKRFRKSNKANMKFAYDWLSKRVVPSTRHDISDVLESMGLKQYNVIDIIKATEGRAFGDDMKVVIEEGDFE